MANIHQISSTGVNRVTNGDCVKVFGVGEVAEGRVEALGFFCADGGSSTDGGDVSTARLAASSFARETQENWRLSVCATASDRARAVLRQAIARANRVMFQRGLAETPVRDLSVSMACGLLYRGVLLYSNLGNVRMLLLRDGEFSRLTEDHTYSNALARRGLVSRKRDDHPYANLVSKRLGMGNETDATSRAIIMRPGDILLALTDGMGFLASSRALNKRVGAMLKEWLAGGVKPSEAASLLFDQVCYYARDARQETRDDATCLVIGLDADDLTRPRLPQLSGAEPSHAAYPGATPFEQRPITRESHRRDVGSEDRTPSIADSKH
jgi:serine/threonine protein phosphatase PrpC